MLGMYYVVLLLTYVRKVCNVYYRRLLRFTFFPVSEIVRWIDMISNSYDFVNGAVVNGLLLLLSLLIMLVTMMKMMKMMMMMMVMVMMMMTTTTMMTISITDI